MLAPFRVEALPKERVWGGSRLRRSGALPIGELWVAGPWLTAADGPHVGRTLEDLAADVGAALVGSTAGAGPGPRFPLLLKLLDTAAWLSVQVHPDDATARTLEGPTGVGKTEAWYVLDASPGAELLAGTRPRVTIGEVRAAIERPAATRGTTVVDLMERVAVDAGDALMIPAGTLHAVGPGILLYELQQPSDLTYRVDDWGREPSAERPLHRAQALASVAVGGVRRLRAARAGRIATCPQFVLDLFDSPAALDPAGRTLHVVSSVGAASDLAGTGWSVRLGALETIVVPASAGPYELRPGAGGRALVASLP